jgi:hypothetical protein
MELNNERIENYYHVLFYLEMLAKYSMQIYYMTCK